MQLLGSMLPTVVRILADLRDLSCVEFMSFKLSKNYCARAQEAPGKAKPGKPQMPKGWQEVLEMQARPTLILPSVYT